MRKILLVFSILIFFTLAIGNPLPVPPAGISVSGFATGDNQNIGLLLDRHAPYFYCPDSFIVGGLDLDETYLYPFFILEHSYYSGIDTFTTDMPLHAYSGSFTVGYTVYYEEYMSGWFTYNYSYDYFLSALPAVETFPYLEYSTTYPGIYSCYMVPPPPGFNYIFSPFCYWVDGYYWGYYEVNIVTGLKEIGIAGPEYPSEYTWIGELYSQWFNEISTNPTQFIEFYDPYVSDWGEYQLITPTGIYNLSSVDTSGTYPVFYPDEDIFDVSADFFIYLTDVEEGWIRDAYYSEELPPAGKSYIRRGFGHGYAVCDTPTPGTSNALDIDENDIIKPVGNIKILKTYPEPFNSQFTIAYTIPKNISEQAILEISNINGRMVKKQQLPSFPGFHSKIISCQDLPSGVYFASVICGATKDTKTITLIK